MALSSAADLINAAQEGRIHQQRFQKNAGASLNGIWGDWSFAGGQPGYDAKIGPALEFSPRTLVRNTSIYHPDAPGMEKRIAGLSLTSGSNAWQQTFVVYDLLGVYSQIDGDSADPQTLVNNLPLPRYTDGEGVHACLIQNVAPAASAGLATITYVDSDGNTKTTQFNVMAGSGALGALANGTTSAAAAASYSGPFIPLASGSRGIRRVVSIIFNTPSSGNFALALMRPLAQFVHNDDQLSTAVQWTERDYYAQHGGRMPRVYDGAYLGFLFRSGNTVTSPTFFGDITFIWG